jgi:hypothetical protein
MQILKCVRVPSQKVQLRIYNDDVDITFDSIKELAKYLKLDMSKSTDRVSLSVFTKYYPNDIGNHNYRMGKEFLKDYNFERVDYKVMETYVHDDRFNDFIYGWYLHVGAFNVMFNGGPACENIYEGSKVRNYYDEQYKNYIKESPRLKNIKFTNKDYKEV